MCFLLINHSLSTNMVSFNFFATAHESAQGAVMVPVVWGSLDRSLHNLPPEKEGKHI